tara:strand:+ start:6319 stop:8106 length:1788 start_codon:yes stop_codon:yes gene_type:complete
MVHSKVSLQDVVYKEDPSIEMEDKSQELVQYTIPLFEYPKNTIALGKKCTRYEKKGIIYHNCYLITNDKGIKIGVFEFPSHRYESYLDYDNPNEIMCSKLLPHLLLFSNAREQVQQSQHTLNAGTTLGTLEPYTAAKLALPYVESMPFSLDMVKPDIQDSGHYLGIANISYSPKTNLVECLSKVLHKQINQTEKQTVAYLNGILSDHISVSMFDTLKTMFTILDQKHQDNKIQLKEVKQRLLDNKTSIKNIHEQDELFQDKMEDIKTLTMQSQHIQANQKYIKTLLKDKEYLRKLDDLNAFKQFIKSGDYVCEPWTIEIFERLMNIKIILLSKDLPQWLVCSRQSPFPHNMSLFNPMYYVILEFTDNDYTAMQLNGISLLTFQSLPLIIKDLVMNRCLEQTEGLYANIPLFVKYKQFKLTKEQRQAIKEPLLDLEPDKDRLVISDSLKKHDYPGTVPFERMDFEHVIDSQLVRDKQWREKLADNYMKPDGRFRLGERDWGSVNHYVTAQQLKEKDFKKSDKLCLNSGSSLSKKSIPYMLCDDNERYSAEFAKFSQNPQLKDILLQTGDAELYMYVPGKSHTRLNSLEKVRDAIQF